MDFVSLVFGAVDVPLVVGIVGLIELAKKWIHLPSRGWLLVLILSGCFAAFLKVNIGSEGWKPFIVQSIVYSMAAEFIYQSWRTIRKRGK